LKVLDLPERQIYFTAIGFVSPISFLADIKVPYKFETGYQD
jgi:hypothetical protein